MPIVNRVAEFQPDIQAWRRDIHEHPELLYDVHRTAALVADRLREFGCDEVVTGIGRTGVVGVIKGGKPAGKGDVKVIGLRADMDALPIEEATNLPYASKTKGLMHACGHDGHTAMLLGAARYLAETRNFAGDAVVIFQPAEEGGAGADRMCDEGALHSPDVEQIFGLHVWPGATTGVVMSNPGVLLAAAGAFEITVRGKGGHGALPHLAIDPVSCAAKIVIELQTIVSRETNPFVPTVVTVGSIHGGDAMNVIPEEVRMSGTFRSLSMDDLLRVKRRIEEIATGIAVANRCEAAVSYPIPEHPPTINDESAWNIAQRAAERLVGTGNVRRMEPVMGSEDFAFYQQRISGCFTFIGVSHADWHTRHSVHHPKFTVDESALPIGAALHVAMALEALAARVPAQV